MKRILGITITTLLLSTQAAAQQQLGVSKVLGPTRDAGIYHYDTETWTRGAGMKSAISPDAIYRNDAPSGYFGTGFESCWVVEELVVPGTGNPNGGSQDSYLIDGFSFSYCKTGAGTVTWFFGGYSSYVPCDDPTSPTGCIAEGPYIGALTGLPGGSACWTITVDLTGGYEACVEADGGICAPGYDGGGLGLDHAGVSFAWLTSDGGTAGPVLAGDPTWIPEGEGTCYFPAFTNACGALVATGLGQQDLFSISNDKGFPCALANGCYFFGGYSNTNGCGSVSNVPFGGFQAVGFADCTVSCDDAVFTEYCDESANPNNTSDIFVSSNDLSGPDIIVSMSGGPDGQSAYLLVSAGSVQVDNPPGAKGSLCLAGATIGRYVKDIQPITGGMATTNLRTNLTTGTAYNLPSAIGGTYTANDTWNFQYWHRQPMGAASTFSSAASVTFN